MRVPCRQHRQVDVLPRFVLCPEDAVDVLFFLASSHPEARYLALVLDPDRQGRLAIPFPPELAHGGLSIERVAGLLTEGLGDDPWYVPGLVLCSRRDGPGTDPTDSDVACWIGLQERCHEHGSVELLDWFLLWDGEARSMSELHGPGWPDEFAGKDL